MIRLPSRSNKSRRLLPSGRGTSDGTPGIERLEARTLFNATLTGTIGAVSVAAGSGPTVVDLNAHFSDPLVTGTAVVLHTTQGDIPLTLFDSQTPRTVANFLGYTTRGEYDGTVIQRVIPGFILQSGGFLSNQTHVPQSPPVPSEAGLPNSFGTIAAALGSGGPGTATSDWLINLGNNTDLNTSAEGGPYTVFGQVIYDGMTVVNQIATLPKGQVAPDFVPDPTAQDPLGGVLPLQNYAGGTITPANYVTLPSVQIVAPLAYGAASDNPSVVSPAIANGRLSLNYGAGQTGTANVTVQATDLGGHVVSTSFAVTVNAVPAPPQIRVPIGTGAARQVRFVDSAGTAASVYLSGPGSGTLTLVGSGFGQTTARTGAVTITGTPQSFSIATTGTSAATVINLAGVGGKTVTGLTAITSDGSLRAINANHVSLAGDLDVGGSIQNVTLGDASGGTIHVNGGSGSLSLVVGALSGEGVDSSEPIRSLQATNWTPAPQVTVPATFVAPSVAKLSVRGSLAANITTGSLGVVTTGAIAPSTWTVSGIAGTVTAGSIDGLILSAAGIGRITSRGAVSNSTILSGGNIVAVTAAALDGSKIEAGSPSLDAGGIPTSFATPATIRTVTINRGAFSNSVIGAQSLGSLSLGTVSTSNNGIPFGVASAHILSLVALVDGKRLVLRNANSASSVSAPLVKAGIVPDDLVIRLV